MLEAVSVIISSWEISAVLQGPQVAVLGGACHIWQGPGGAPRGCWWALSAPLSLQCVGGPSFWRGWWAGRTQWLASGRGRSAYSVKGYTSVAAA